MRFVYFYAEDSLRCRPYTPYIEEVADELGIDLDFVDISERRDLIARYNIDGFPALYKLGKNNEVLDRLVGLRPVPEVKAFLLGEVYVPPVPQQESPNQEGAVDAPEEEDSHTGEEEGRQEGPTGQEEHGG